MTLKQFIGFPIVHFDTPSRKWTYILISACFACFFLVLFQPYGLHEEMENPENTFIQKILFFGSISLSTTIGLFISQFLLLPLFRIKRSTVKSHLVTFLFEAFLLTLITFGLSFLIPDLGNDFEKEISISFQLKNYFRAVIILVFPYVGTVIYTMIQELHSEVTELEEQITNYQNQFKQKNKQQTIQLKDENNQLEFSLPLKALFYIEASNQYIIVHYKKENEFKKQIVRNRLKNFLKENTHSQIKQCHRSFAINLLNVKHLSRSNSKEFAILDTIEPTKIPISKSYSNIIKQEISQNS